MAARWRWGIRSAPRARGSCSRSPSRCVAAAPSWAARRSAVAAARATPWSYGAAEGPCQWGLRARRSRSLAELRNALLPGLPLRELPELTDECLLRLDPMVRIVFGREIL